MGASNRKSTGGRLNRQATTRQPGLRGFLYWWLESEHNPKRHYFDLFLVGIIAFSIAVIVTQVTIAPETHQFLITADLVCLGIFAAEYLGRFLVNTDFKADVREFGLGHAVRQKIRWMLKPMSIIDLVALVPSTRALRALRVFRLLRLARLLRVFKLARYTTGLEGYVDEIKKRAHEFMVLGGVTGGIIVFAAITVFCVEKPAGNENIRDIFDALWWSVVTLTTVGYGDAYPITDTGRVVATLLMLTSISTVGGLGAIITSIIMFRVENIKAGRIGGGSLQNHILFCGWTPCAQKVAQTLEEQGILDEHQLVVLHDEEVHDSVGLYHNGAVTSPDNLDEVSAADAAYAVVFHGFGEQGDSVRRVRADRKATLTALHIGAVNQRGQIIVELYDGAHIRALGGETGDETNQNNSAESRLEVIEKEGYDADIILNTIRNAGHTSEMLRDLSNFRNSRISTRSLHEITNGPRAGGCTVDEVKRALNESGRRATFLGYLDPQNNDPVVNPDNDTMLEPSCRTYVLETVPSRGQAEKADVADATSRPAPAIATPVMPLEGDVLFLGWNSCAGAVLRKLFSQQMLPEDRKVTVVSEHYSADDARVNHVEQDYSESAVLQQLDWAEFSVVIVFFEMTPGEATHEVDTRNVLTAMEAAQRRRREDTRVIVEVHEEKHARLLKSRFKDRIEIPFKERMDADLIANTIINPGRITKLIREIASFDHNRIDTCRLGDFTEQDSVTVSDLRLVLLDEFPPVILLGLLRAGSTSPMLNPSPQEVLTEGDAIYCLRKA
jgi:voltage-gated potassium channel